MLNFLWAEIWRTLHRPAGKVLLFLVILLPIALNLFAFSDNQWVAEDVRITVGEAMGIAVILMPFAGIFFLMAIVDLAFADENRLCTMKNSICTGISRPVYYFGKVISGMILAFFHLALSWISFFLSGFLLLPVDWLELQKNVQDIALYLLAVIPLWLGVLGILYLLYFSFQKGLLAAVAVAVGSVFILPAFLALNVPIAQWITNLQLVEWLALVSVTELAEIGKGPLIFRCWLIGAGYWLICITVGWILFSRRDIR